MLVAARADLARQPAEVEIGEVDVRQSPAVEIAYRDGRSKSAGDPSHG
jgi:hypothetical protein